MLCPILYIKNFDEAISADPKMRVKDDYVLNKAEYPKNVTAVKSIILNYQPNYSRQYQYQGSGNQLMSNQCGKTGDY